ncbi:DNA mismatch repair protein Msh6 [Dendrothele bispora CBS 962.96]|uniref:DNA mismatch repair protein n=1 Tax=Dendrothele bispora (strain CBS 962.96) TaxID=1314807 RepID=A0A4V4HHF8_DENBC|nr:DNA mismatch repair protein Msh6 [Dendrothele bispora CBS 962.96]
MASKSKSSDNLKQKTLTSFFGKPQNDSSSKSKTTQNAKASGVSSSATKRKDASKTLSSSPPTQKAPKSSGTNFKTPKSSAGVSSSPRSVSSSAKTPPTSDYIDVDMEDSAEEKKSTARVKTGKRKIVLEDSDEENQASGRSSSMPESSPVARASRKKKARLSMALSEEEEDEEDTEVKSSFSQRLTKFKKSPAKKGRKSSAVSDDDDFIVPSDSDDEVRSIKSSNSRASSRKYATTDDDDEDEDDVPKKSRPKPKKAASSSADVNAGGSFSFLTAAERREQDKKNDKKAAEDPYSFLLDVKDKDGRRPGDPKYDPRTLYIPPRAWKEFTPFEKQFWEIKQNHYDTILFFQKGKFFELYEDDARIGHQQFDLKLTQRVKMSMVGVPEMSFNFWAAKFLGKGYKVGRVDQSETALGAEMRLATDKKNGKPRGGEKEKIVRRELNKVYTNGTLVDGQMITDDEAGHCISIREIESSDGSNNTFGVCVLDCSTSQFNLSAFEDDICRTKLETLMRQIRPKEMVFTKGNLSVSTTRLLKSILPAACLWTGLREVEGLDYDTTLKELKERYPIEDDMEDTDDDQILPASVPGPIREMADSKCAIEALGAMIWYLQQLNIDKDILSMKNFNIYDPMKKGEGLVLDGQTLAHIEILMNNEGTEDGSLLKLLSRCATPFGKRLFRIWLCMPLRDIEDINARLDAVEDLLNSPTFEGAFAEIAKGLPDLERVVSRIHAKNCSVRDFLKVLNSFKKLSQGLTELADASESFKSKTILGLLRTAPELLPNIKNIESMFQKPATLEKDIELIPRKGKDETYDGIMTEIKELEEGLDHELEAFEEKLGCKLGWWHSASGNKEIYLIETAASHKNVPKDWTKNSGTKAKTRWLAGSLQKSIRSLKEARENRNTAIKEFKYRLFAEFDTDRSIWLRAIRVFAELDCLLSLAKSSAAIGEPACRPEFIKGQSAWIDFKDLRHPTLAMSSRLQDFIPNSVRLGGGVGKIALLTGPNMAGKSTVMRMTAMGVIMAQLGMYVPAEKARLCPVDAILTRMGAYDNMFSNSSTFKVELDECCKILRDATPKSFVILDELGRGTSTYDGMAIAGAVLHQLATHTQPLSFFATHYGALTDDFAYHPNIRNMHMSTLVDDEKRAIIFLYKLVEGVATGSFGTHVANLAGVPLEVVERADVISKNFAQQFKEKLQAKQEKSASARLPLTAQADFVYLIKLASKQLTMPEDPVRQRQVVAMLKKVAQKYVS